MRIPLAFAAATAVALAAAGAGLAAYQSGAVTPINLPLKLPAVGNVDAVKQWRFGRIQQAEMTAGPDVFLTIRTADEREHRIVGPAGPLSELARASNWMSSTDAARVGRAHWVERMIAFDADANDRLIAMISLEPTNRNRNRLRRALAN